MNNVVKMEWVSGSITSILTRLEQAYHIKRTHFKSELTDYGPGAPKVRDDAFRQQTEHVVCVSFKTLLIGLKRLLRFHLLFRVF